MKRWLLLAALVGCVTPHRDAVTVAQHTFDVQFDEELDAQSKGGRPLAIVRTTLEKSLAKMKETYPAAFARQMPRLERVEVRSLGGERIEIVTVLRDPRAELTGGDVAHELAMDFARTVGPRFQNRAPEQITAAEAADWFDWVRLASPNGDQMMLDILRFASGAGGGDVHVRRWLLDQADDLSRRGVTRPDPPPALVAERSAYVAWLNRNVATLDDGERADVAFALFRLPQGTIADPEIAYGYAAPAPRGTWAWNGFDVFAFGAASVDRWIAKDEVNVTAAFFQSAAATVEGTKRLAQLLAARPDLASTCARSLHDAKRREAVAKELDASNPAAAATLRASAR